MNFKSKVLLTVASLFLVPTFSQQKETDSSTVKQDKRLYLNLDIASRYLWRGQCWGGDYIAVQPTVEFSISPKLTLGFWATTNFKRDYFYPDGVSAYKGYQEIDFYLYYQLTDFLQFQLWDYYWPSVSKVEGVNNNYFNYGPDGSKTVDAMVYFDFSDGYRYPFNATISTLIAGNDFRYDTNGENPKRNFTTYLELGYTFSFFKNSSQKSLQDIEVSPVVGAVLNNEAAYYTYADYDKVSWVNLGVSTTKTLSLGGDISMPITLSYTHNGAVKNTEIFGKNFVVATLSLSY
ncbi:MAG: hypothetical protein C0525_09010 [Flavobacterium sp.]|jgi:hypothetical protein|uniref:hypothetical protein n=1 Tax=Flavobacterium sp. TaxID=239 RepID=UPI0025BEF20C|nr:hypothetical protein [Flavobacterium sp.]MBA4134852.1 hypothetical protein [Flavobacterium sp.]